MDMQTYQDSIEDLSKCTVAIKEAGGNGRVLGTGVIVTDDGLILTCYHVIRNKHDKTLNNEKNFNISFANNEEIEPAQIKEDYCNPSLDIAFLELQGKKIPDQAKVSQLSELIYFGNPFASIGFRKPESFDSLTSKGEIRKITDAKPKENTEKSTRPMLQIYSDEIEGGMSGAPVLDLATNSVVGIISEHWVTTSNVDKKLNFAIPVESIIQVYPEIREKNLGLGSTSEIHESISNYITSVIDECDGKTDFLGRKLQLHQYYVEQNAIFIAKDGSKYWTSNDEDILSHQIGNKDKVKKIIESELLQTDFFHLLVGASFGGGTSTLAKWLGYEYARAYKDTEFYRDGRRPASHNVNELNCIPIVLPLIRKGLASEIYRDKTVDDLLEDIIAPSLKLNPATILLILDGINQLNSDEIKVLKKKYDNTITVIRV